MDDQSVLEELADQSLIEQIREVRANYAKIREVQRDLRRRVTICQFLLGRFSKGAYSFSDGDTPDSLDPSKFIAGMEARGVPFEFEEQVNTLE